MECSEFIHLLPVLIPSQARSPRLGLAKDHDLSLNVIVGSPHEF